MKPDPLRARRIEALAAAVDWNQIEAEEGRMVARRKPRGRPPLPKPFVRRRWKLVEARRSLGLTQQSLGARIGVSAAVVCGWENGEVMPRVRLLRGIASALGVTIEELVGMLEEGGWVLECRPRERAD